MSTIANAGTVTNQIYPTSQLGAHNTIDCESFYYYPAHMSINSPTKYAHLVSLASYEVCIWDPYIWVKDTVFFNRFSNTASYKVLTRKNNLSNQQGYKFDLETVLKPTNLDLEIRAIDCGTQQKPYDFHDRYLIIDSKAYFIGGSLSYHSEQCPSERSTAISMLSSEATQIVCERFKDVWDKATSLLKITPQDSMP